MILEILQLKVLKIILFAFYKNAVQLNKIWAMRMIGKKIKIRYAVERFMNYLFTKFYQNFQKEKNLKICHLKKISLTST